MSLLFLLLYDLRYGGGTSNPWLVLGYFVVRRCGDFLLRCYIRLLPVDLYHGVEGWWLFAAQIQVADGRVCGAGLGLLRRRRSLFVSSVDGVYDFHGSRVSSAHGCFVYSLSGDDWSGFRACGRFCSRISIIVSGMGRLVVLPSLWFPTQAPVVVLVPRFHSVVLDFVLLASSFMSDGLMDFEFGRRLLQ
ncbi:hypothetical protein LOK49_LG07G01263 [Camellia lanceoleosa]|uniref:Uncharacterized protein n=1 Tax=Camellia lanceoleosa TaxID=1840588 RepID=A0ACC0H4Z1_9ERIC|nr:hypothetical protein LOK49_LG07G01263 [Camellia lanceoleosa]